MSDPLKNDARDAYAALFENELSIAVDRATAELRAHRPIIIESDDGVIIVAALDSISPSVFSTFAATGEGYLALSEHRARSLGLTVDEPVLISLSGMTQDAALLLASAPHLPAPTLWSAGGKAVSAAIALCKNALLLPSVLIQRIAPDADLPPAIHRVKLDQLGLSEPDAHFTLEIVSEADVPLAGSVQARFVVFRGGPTARDQVAVIVGKPDPTQPILVRVHSACLTGDLFGSLRCDCGDQLRTAIARLEGAGGGVLLYLDQEGRGIGIGNKMRAYALQDDGFDTIDADAVLGFDADERRYEYAAAILVKLGYRRIRLLTNNPTKIEALTRAGIEVVTRQPLMGTVTTENLQYLYTKATRADHMLDGLLDLPEPMSGE